MYDSEPETIKAWQQGDEQAVHTVFTIYYPQAVRLAVLSGQELEYSLTDQNGEELAGAGTECEGFPQDGSPMHCFITSSSFNPRYTAKQITITWDVLQLYLIQPTGKTDKLAGPWHFQFTIPFHSQSLGPVGPFAQPTHMP